MQNLDHFYCIFSDDTTWFENLPLWTNLNVIEIGVLSKGLKPVSPVQILEGHNHPGLNQEGLLFCYHIIARVLNKPHLHFIQCKCDMLR